LLNGGSREIKKVSHLRQMLVKRESLRFFNQAIKLVSLITHGREPAQICHIRQGRFYVFMTAAVFVTRK
jgi:hypothetical protein